MPRRQSKLTTAATLLPLALGIGSMATSPPTRARTAVRAPSVTCGIHCGTERWPIKTMSDPEAGDVNLTPEPATVASLTALAAPDSDTGGRLNDAEKQTWQVQANLVGYKQELSSGKGDRDFHIVIADTDDPSNTMIVEIPNSACAGVCNSTQLAAIEAARQQFSDAFPDSPPGPTFKVVKSDKPVQVEVAGVAFFDFFHGQTGVARNCVELHPVLNFKFLTPGPFQAEINHEKDPKKTSADEHACIGE